LRGSFKGELTRNGLRLHQKGVDFELPIGTPAAYRGGNRLSLPLEGREVVVALARPRWYTARLARDVADFLNGRRPMPRAADYQVPSSLLVLAMLPLGIAAAGITGRVLGSGIVGGALNGAVWGGLGGGLAGLCWWLCQRDKWPVAARLGACLGMSIVGYGVLGLAIVLSGLGSGIADAEWQEFAPPGARCSLWMPGTPVGRDQTVPTPAGNVRAHMYIVERRQNDAAFMLVYSDYPPAALKADVSQLFDGAQKGAAANAKGTVARQKPIDLEGIPGREVEISIPGKGNMLVRYYLSGKRLYQVAAAGPRASARDVEKLFASFKILALEK
jgi:hypothetical protein